ncbi:Post-GPI attachment to proteins factor 2-like [Operophtera brumata]|uniref:Post-GPI attachment to proteins factor 2-like n=1 Tax=Operophtera brumata TaxID=104452 RepID=A0A0L7LK26_OPEBR|nr:Post-GPI attachment to proteins factor 2-like [Operophtera brumata]
MVYDAQVESPPNLDVRDNEKPNCTKENNLDSSVKVVEYRGILWTCGLRETCITALWLPLGALIFCYVTATIFQSDDIHETHCRVSIILIWKTGHYKYLYKIYLRFKNLVYNVVPSISAITGISPQRYIWRICIAFHLGPRLLIGSLYYNYHQQRTAHIIEEQTQLQAKNLGLACYWLNFIELLALTGVTLLHMYCRAKVGCVGAAEVEPLRTNKLIWALFFVAVAATLGLIVFFLRHRLLCRPLVRDLPLHQLQIVLPSEKTD